MCFFATGVACHPWMATQSYRLLLLAAYGLATVHCALSVGMTQQFFVFFVPGDLDLRTRVRFYTMYLTANFDCPTFSRSEVIVRTSKQTNIHTHTDKQTNGCY